jgi:8-oxo-dGTP pyrophosphatase MutT (NUDIX family)
LRPKDAATLIILRNNKEVLLGLRSRKHVFMPNKYVFPGGKVDGGDARVPCPIALRPQVAARLEYDCSPARARAIAMAAVRETWEETGLILGASHRPALVSQSPNWREFYAMGMVPALDKLDYIARAITPPGRVRRFDARFFMVDASHLHGDIRSNGELEDLQWVPLKSVHRLALASVTGLVLEFLKQWLADGKTGDSQPLPIYQQRRGKDWVEYQNTG